MHQLLATFFSLLVALCHHTSFSARPVEAAELPTVVQSGDSFASPARILPDRYQLARYTTADGGYAESACLSCRRTDASSINR